MPVQIDGPRPHVRARQVMLFVDFRDRRARQRARAQLRNHVCHKIKCIAMPLDGGHQITGVCVNLVEFQVCENFAQVRA